MIKMIKQYNAYTSKKITAAAYVLYPFVLLTIYFVLAFVFRNSESSVSLLSVMTMISMIYTIIVVCLSDRFNIGTILVNNAQINEMAKTSPNGKTMVLNVTKWDIFQRLILIVVIYLGLLIPRALRSPKEIAPLLLLSVMGVVSCHMGTSLLCWICRNIENTTLSTIIYSVGFISVMPTMIMGVFPFEEFPTVFIIVSTAVYLAADVIINVIGIKLMKRFIKKEWYNDRNSEGK